MASVALEDFEFERRSGSDDKSPCIGLGSECVPMFASDEKDDAPVALSGLSVHAERREDLAGEIALELGGGTSTINGFPGELLLGRPCQLQPYRIPRLEPTGNALTGELLQLGGQFTAV